MAHFTLHRHPHVRTEHALTRLDASAHLRVRLLFILRPPRSRQRAHTVTESRGKDGEQLFAHRGTEQYVTHIL